MYEALLSTGVLLLVLALVGWGVGFAAALMRTSLRVETVRAFVGGMALGLLVAAGSLYAYLVVLDRVGLLEL